MKKILFLFALALSLYGCATPYEQKVVKIRQEIQLRQLDIQLHQLSLQLDSLTQDYMDKRKLAEIEAKKAELALKTSEAVSIVESKKAEQALRNSEIEMKKTEKMLRESDIDLAGKEIDNEAKRAKMQKESYENRSVFIKK